MIIKKIFDKPKYTNKYIITAIWDYNDADYDTCVYESDEADLDDDETFKFVLSILYSYGRRFTQKIYHYSKIYEKEMITDEEFNMGSYTIEYLSDVYLLGFGDDSIAHSVKKVEIIYYNELGIGYPCEIERLLFEDEENNFMKMFKLLYKDYVKYYSEDY